jgi:hypothetical protein
MADPAHAFALCTLAPNTLPTTVVDTDQRAMGGVAHPAHTLTPRAFTPDSLPFSVVDTDDCAVARMANTPHAFAASCVFSENTWGSCDSGLTS